MARTSSSRTRCRATRRTRPPGWQVPRPGATPAFLITHQAAGFHGYGMGSYTFFNRDVPVFSANAFEMANTPGSELHDLFTVALSTAGSGGITHVVNGVGSSSTVANPDAPVDVVSYP